LAGRRRGCRVLFPERTFPTKAEDNSGLKHPQASQPVESGLFLRPQVLRPHGPNRTPQFRPGSCTQRHPLLWATWLVIKSHLDQEPSGPDPHLARFSPSERLKNEGQKSPYPLPRPAGGVFILEPFRERPAGPEQTRAERDQS